MPTDDRKWEDEEETIVSFRSVPHTSPEIGKGSPEDDPDATIVRRSPEIQEDLADRTVVAGGTQEVRAVEAMAWLVIVKTSTVRTGQLFALDKMRMVIGRGKDVDIFINDAKVGSTHAAVRYEISTNNEGQFVLHDLASTNGTMLNAHRLLAPAILKDGDRISIGDTELAFKRL